MAVIGARPAPRFTLLGGRPRSRPRRRAAATRGRRLHMSRRITAPVDVRPFIVLILVAAGLALFYLSQSTRVAATGYEIDALEATLAERRAEQQQLIWAIGQARSPAEITRRATRELHLTPLEPDAVMFAPATDEPAD